MTKGVDVSVAITFHAEGKIAADTIESVKKALHNSDFSYEIIAHIDKGDEATTKTVEKAFADMSDVRLIHNNFGDLSHSRNYCTKIAKGKYISFIDGDDIVSENWYKEAYKKLMRFPGVIVHPQYNVTFGGKGRNRVWKMHDSLSEQKDRLILVNNNRWCVTCMMPIEIAKMVPYEPFRPGLGYEDWHFNANTRARGIKHVVVKDTVVYYRVSRENSLFQQSQQEKFALPKTSEFSNDDTHPKYGNLSFALFSSRIKSKINYLTQKTKIGRAVNNSVGKNRISANTKAQIANSGLINGPVLYVDSYNSEQRLLGRFYYKLLSSFDKKCSSYAFDAKIKDYISVDFLKTTNKLTDNEKELLLTQLIVQNDVTKVVFSKDIFYKNWINNHKKLLDTLKIKVNIQL